MDGIRYDPIDSRDVPPEFASVPVKLIDNGFDGKVSKISLVAGSVGMELTASGHSGDVALASMQPVSGWWLFIDKKETRDIYDARYSDSSRSQARWIGQSVEE